MARAPAKPKVFFNVGEGNIRANLAFRQDTGGVPQTIEKVVYDGDTINVDIAGSGALRFLGVDTAEVKLGNSALDSDKWVALLSDPALLNDIPLDPGLKQHLTAKFGPDTARNHHRHALASQAHLQKLVEDDMAEQGLDATTFRLFTEFSYEVFDGFARFLVFVNRAQKESPRPLSYNERMLRDGFSLPFFIWPNVAPFRDFKTVADAVPVPNETHKEASKGKLGLARRLVAEARVAAQSSKTGVFNPDDALIMAAFELRFLQRKAPPSRAVIDLSRKTDTLLHPQSYWKVPNPEDRLFVPAEFIPAFAARGWKLEGW
jgi:hypothetical protein